MEKNNQKIPDILLKIVETKKDEVQSLFQFKNDFKMKCFDLPKPKNFAEALTVENNSRTVIAEVKKASPSAGIISHDFDPVKIALEYKKGNADCISVLTDVKYFNGHPDFLSTVAKVVDLPVLRKDFIICEEQIYESRSLGAASFLLIAAILDLGQLVDFIELGRSLGMEPLVEVHDEYELEKALGAGSKIVGINNRNLRNFSVDTDTTISLIPKIPPGKIVVGESGIMSVEIAEKLYRGGCNSLLIGELLMRSENKSKLISEIKKIPN
jgi:indole-3-glycerol phosphate synthase